jgi:hypothetical protein
LPEIAACLLKRFEGCKVVQVELEDLDLANHLSGKKHKFLKITFNTSGDLNDAKKALKPLITANQKLRADSDYEEDFEAVDNSANVKKNQMKASHDPLTHIIDIREFDVVSAVCVGVGECGCGCGCGRGCGCDVCVSVCLCASYRVILSCFVLFRSILFFLPCFGLFCFGLFSILFFPFLFFCFLLFPNLIYYVQSRIVLYLDIFTS